MAISSETLRSISTPERLETPLGTLENINKRNAMPQADTPVLDLLANMTADSVSASSLDPQTLMLARIAALVAVDAPPVSYLMNLESAVEAGVDAEQVRGVLTAIAPIVGTARIAAATGRIVEAIEIEIEIAELEDEAAAAELEQAAR